MASKQIKNLLDAAQPPPPAVMEFMKSCEGILKNDGDIDAPENKLFGGVFDTTKFTKPFPICPICQKPVSAMLLPTQAKPCPQTGPPPFLCIPFSAMRANVCGTWCVLSFPISHVMVRGPVVPA